MLAVLTLLACTAKPDDSAVPAPSIAWLAPTDGSSVAVGPTSCSVVVEAFTLQDPAKHGEGGAEGYVAVLVDGVATLTTSTTTFDLELSAGPHTLLAQLTYVDGDEVSATATTLCGEDDPDPACGPVTASVTVTAE